MLLLHNCMHRNWYFRASDKQRPVVCIIYGSTAGRGGEHGGHTMQEVL
nr:MAG TPA: Tocopherol cyclase [Caudoviricetes sp.]